MKVPIRSWVFAHCTLIMDGTKFTTIFEDGTRHLQDFGNQIEIGFQWEVSWRNGYGHDQLRYFQEHDFVHHWLAHRVGNGISTAIYENSPDPIRLATMDIRCEEDQVHRLQRCHRMPDLDRSWILNQIGECGDALMADLSRDLDQCFEGRDLYPGSDYLSCHERMIGMDVESSIYAARHTPPF